MIRYDGRPPRPGSPGQRADMSLIESHVSPSPNLSVLARRLASARDALEAERRNTQRQPGRSEIQRRHLLSCLEAYAAGLAERRLPIPPALRDELRLRRRL